MRRLGATTPSPTIRSTIERVHRAAAPVRCRLNAAEREGGDPVATRDPRDERVRGDAGQHDD